MWIKCVLATNKNFHSWGRSNFFVVQACLRASPLVEDEAKLAIVFTSFSTFYFSPASGKLLFPLSPPPYFGITRRNKKINLKVFCTKADFWLFNLLLTTSIRSQKPEPPAVSGVCLYSLSSGKN